MVNPVVFNPPEVSFFFLCALQPLWAAFLDLLACKLCQLCGAHHSLDQHPFGVTDSTTRLASKQMISKCGTLTAHFSCLGGLIYSVLVKK